MAIVEDHLQLVVGLMDNGGERTTRTYEIVAGTTPEDAQTLIAGVFLPALDALTDAVITGYTLGTVYVNDAISFPANGVQNENQLIMTVGIEEAPLKNGTLTIPAPVIGAFVATSGQNANVMNPSAAIVTNFVAQFAPGGIFLFSDGEQADTTRLYGKRRHVRNSNG